MTTTRSETLASLLAASPVHRDFVTHSFFRRVRTAPLTLDAVAVFLGQWWHPLSYFTTFLARCVTVVPDIESKSAIAHILNQEAGCGDASRAHEVVYAASMEQAGFDRASVTESAAFPETVALVDGYEQASLTRVGALGFIFATEVTDLQMVSSIGTAVERVTGVSDLEWVRIHVEQEPDHVDDAGRTLLRDFTAAEAELVVDAAEQMWRLWTAFFDRLDVELAAPAPTTPLAPGAQLS